MIEIHICGDTDNTEQHTAAHDLLDEPRATDLAGLFRAMGDPNRMRIVSLLMDHELCVHDITTLLDLSQSAVSHQMRALRAMRVVRARKDGRHVYYTLDDDHIRQLFAVGLEHVDDA